jgi:hypothetical protein
MIHTRLLEDFLEHEMRVFAFRNLLQLQVNVLHMRNIPALVSDVRKAREVRIRGVCVAQAEESETSVLEVNKVIVVQIRDTLSVLNDSRDILIASVRKHSAQRTRKRALTRSNKELDRFKAWTNKRVLIKLIRHRSCCAFNALWAFALGRRNAASKHSEVLR